MLQALSSFNVDVNIHNILQALVQHGALRRLRARVRSLNVPQASVYLIYRFIDSLFIYVYFRFVV